MRGRRVLALNGSITRATRCNRKFKEEHLTLESKSSRQMFFQIALWNCLFQKKSLLTTTSSRESQKMLEKSLMKLNHPNQRLIKHSLFDFYVRTLQWRLRFELYKNQPSFEEAARRWWISMKRLAACVVSFWNASNNLGHLGHLGHFHQRPSMRWHGWHVWCMWTREILATPRRGYIFSPEKWRNLQALTYIHVRRKLCPFIRYRRYQHSGSFWWKAMEHCEVRNQSEVNPTS